MAYVYKKRNKWGANIRMKSVNLHRVFTSKALASAWAKKVETEIINGTYLDQSELVKVSVKDLLMLYFDQAKTKTAHSDRLLHEIGKISRYPIAELRLGYLAGKHVANMRDQMLDEGLSSSTVRKYMGLLQRAINVGRKELGIPLTHNAVMLVRKPKESNPRDRILTDEEWEKLLTACSRSTVYYLKQLVILLRETMCRRGELIRLTTSDVNLDEFTAFLGKTKNGSPRYIGLSPLAVKTLKELPVGIDGKYFPRIFQTKYEGNSLSKAFKRATVAAGIKNFRLHDCRHMACSDRTMQGWSISELSAQGGWKSLSQLKRYTHVKAEYLAEKMRSNSN